MTAAPKLDLVSVEEYLAGELVSTIKHEYLGGFVYAMAGARNAHNLVASNVLGSLYARLRGKNCRPYNSDTKIRAKFLNHVRFYYPDASVICQPNPPNDSFQDNPTVLVEVLSKGTRRTDVGEKKDVYLSIPTLAVYILVEQSSPKVLVFRRTEEGFVPEIHEGQGAVVPLPEIETELPLAEIYEAVEFVPEPVEDEAAG